MNMSNPYDQGGIAADERFPTTPVEPTGSTARADASTLASDAGDATKHVAGVAKTETKSVAAEAGRQARRLLGRVQGELRTQATTQQSRLADGLHSTASSFSTMAETPGANGYAPELVRAAGQRLDAAGNWLGQRDPGALVEEVKSFARRRPGVFLAIAVGAGVVVGRLTRALATPSEDGDRSAAASDRTLEFDAPAATPPRLTQPPVATTVGAGAGTTDSNLGSGLGDQSDGTGAGTLPPAYQQPSYETGDFR
jgi:hypothetical protein